VPLRTVDWRIDHLAVIDQTLLPGELRVIELRTTDEVVDAIKRLVVRGAPAIGVCGALGVAMAAHRAEREQGTVEAAREDAARIRAARPTAVNLMWAVDRVLEHFPGGAAAVEAEAVAMLDEDVRTNRTLGERGADLLTAMVPGRPLALQTHCNAGGLACVEWGTALGIVQALHNRQLVREVFADETRPLLQGARLTAFELVHMGVPVKVVVDGAGPSVIARGMVDAVVVGADRIAANGDAANKIGTYPLALAAARAGIPFIVAAPESTVDLRTATGDDIHIELRDPAEVLGWGSVRTAPEGADAYNPAFDVTPHDLITAIVTERRVVRPADGGRMDDPIHEPSAITSTGGMR
jgi:methylthioribose-1-phosphate isomerase